MVSPPVPRAANETTAGSLVSTATAAPIASGMVTKIRLSTCRVP